jgi:RimJ/RimL family protein N-acetyltransferase
VFAPTLTDGRVTLRPIVPGDLAAIDAGVHDPDVVRWIGPAWPTDEILARLQRLAEEGSPTFVICEGASDLQGLVWLNKPDPDPSTRSVGYWLLPEARGRGLATSAVRLISRWAIEAVGVTRLRLKTAPDNVRSQGVAERSGFRRIESDGVDLVFELDMVER